MTGIPVTAMPMLAPGLGRLHLVATEGSSIGAIVAEALPGIGPSALTQVRVTMTTAAGSVVVRRRHWDRVKPKAGVHVVVRLVPGKDALRSALMILVSVASAGIASFLVGPAVLGLTTGAGLVKGLITFGLTALGGLLVNALLPPETQKQEKPTYSISGFQNEYRPNAPIPDVMGEIRFAPPFAGASWTEVVGDWIYARACVDWGYGPLEISDLRLGETSFDDYDEIEYETRYGYADDAALTLYRSQVIETSIGTELIRPAQRDDSGEPISGPTESKPVKRVTARDVTGAGFVFSFPTGLAKITKRGKHVGWGVDIQSRYRNVADGVDAPWVDQALLPIRAKKEGVGFYRFHQYSFPERGTYEVQLEMMSDEQISSHAQFFQRCDWSVMQCYRPEYPFPWNVPVARTALRIKATGQINGQVNNINGLVRRRTPDFDAETGTWIERATRNPASLALRLLRSPLNAEPAEDDEIDWPAFEAWHDFCRVKKLCYDRVHDFPASREDVLRAIGAAGRAAVLHDGLRHTVIVDQPGKPVVEHINPRNSWDVSWSTGYFDPPDGVRVTFLDRTNDYKQATRIIPWPGFVGTPVITEVMDLPGMTDPAQIWIEARRRMYEMLYRALTYQATQRGTVRSATVGDHVRLSRDIVVDTMHSARVKRLRGREVELDDAVVMETGKSYALQWIDVETVDGYLVQTGRTRVIQTVVGERKVVRFAADGIVPSAGVLVHFGPAEQVSYDAIVVKIDRGTDDTSLLTMMPEAVEIDHLTDAEVPPAWDGRVGDDIGPVFTPPAIPKVTGVRVGVTETDLADGFIVMLEPGTGTGAAVPVQGYELRHRKAGSSTWLGPVAGTAAAGAVVLSGLHDPGDTVEFEPRAISIGGTPSGWGARIARTIPIGQVLEFPAPSGLRVIAGSRNLGSGPVVVLRAYWEPLDDEDLAIELWWAGAGTGFAEPQKVLLPARTTDHEIIGVTQRGVYDVRVRAYEPGTGEIGYWAEALSVRSVIPVVLGLGGGVVLGLGGGKVLSLTGIPKIVGIGGGMVLGIGGDKVLRI